MNARSQHIWAIVPAAGVGSRMESSVPKQYLVLDDKTIIEHTVDRLLQNRHINRVVVCVAEDDPVWPDLPICKDPHLLTTIGGETRAHSVLNGLDVLSGTAAAADWVIVHDAARPCLSEEILNTFIETLFQDSIGGLLAVPSKDTLKAARKNGNILQSESTIDRTTVWRAQTPQMFRYEQLKEAMEKAVLDGWEITDEASAMEKMGFQPRIVRGEEWNLKVTTPDDLPIARVLLQRHP